jgi:hypothetical protein
METLPYLPLKLILDQLEFQDILNLIWTPGLRKIILGYFKREMNMKDLIRMELLEIFDLLVSRYPYVIDDLHDLLIERGMPEFFNQSIDRQIKMRFIKDFTINELSLVEPEKASSLSFTDYREYILDKYSMSDVLQLVLFNTRSLDQNNQRRKILWNYLDLNEYSQERALGEHIAKFLDVYFYDPRNGFKNVLEIFESIPNFHNTKKSQSKLLWRYGVEMPLKSIDFIEKIFM